MKRLYKECLTFNACKYRSHIKFWAKKTFDWNQEMS
jgi:hypothetical protein